MGPENGNQTFDEQTMRRLAQLADGTLSGPERADLEAEVAASPTLGAALERQRAGASALRGLDLQASPALRERIAAPSARSSRPARRRRFAIPAALAGAAAAALAAVLLLPAGGGNPTVVEAARLSTQPPAESVAVDSSNSKLLAADVEGVPFPNWRGEFGWQAGRRALGSARRPDRPDRLLRARRQARRLHDRLGRGNPRPAGLASGDEERRPPAFACRGRAPGRDLVARRPDLRALERGRRRPEADRARNMEGRRSGAVLSAMLVQGDGRRLDPETAGDHIDTLFRAACALCGSRQLAEDLVQETYVKVLARPRFLRRDDDLGYLIKALAEHLVQPPP